MVPSGLENVGLPPLPVVEVTVASASVVTVTPPEPPSPALEEVAVEVSPPVAPLSLPPAPVVLLVELAEVTETMPPVLTADAAELAVVDPEPVALAVAVDVEVELPESLVEGPAEPSLVRLPPLVVSDDGGSGSPLQAVKPNSAREQAILAETRGHGVRWNRILPRIFDIFSPGAKDNTGNPSNF